MRKRSPRQDKGVDFVVGQPGMSQSINSAGGQTFLDEPHEILVCSETLYAEDRLDPFENTRRLKCGGV
jgi:hypothetical protein